ncbi:hypothetical protein IGI37_000104 [Enterococcus sp. AZ194]|uniref:hypothetical protein n=1 Tax=Enterococcus sp. AZ194 TaxID=2774629 RepID=UPI003F1E6537
MTKADLKKLFGSEEELTSENFAKLIDALLLFGESELPGGGLKLTNNRLHLATDQKWQVGEGHLSDMIRLQWTADRAKPALVWTDETGADKTAIISHYKANDAGQADHVHLSIETTKNDGTGQIHTRMEFPFDTDICEIQTWSSNFTVNGISRVAGAKASNRDFTFATANKKLGCLDENGRIIPDKMYSKRWTVRANSTDETGNNAGSDLEIVRYKDDGTPVDTAVFVKRSNGNIGLGTRSPTRALDIVSDAIRLRNTKTPASATAYGEKGMICWDADYLYICVADSKWTRTKLDTW